MQNEYKTFQMFSPYIYTDTLSGLWLKGSTTTTNRICFLICWAAFNHFCGLNILQILSGSSAALQPLLCATVWIRHKLWTLSNRVNKYGATSDGRDFAFTPTSRYFCVFIWGQFSRKRRLFVPHEPHMNHTTSTNQRKLKKVTHIPLAKLWRKSTLTS